MANRCLIGRPGPSISLPSAVNLNGLAGLDESAFTPNWQMICVGRRGLRRLSTRHFNRAKSMQNPRVPPPAAPSRFAACESARTARRDSDARAGCHAKGIAIERRMTPCHGAVGKQGIHAQTPAGRIKAKGSCDRSSDARPDARGSRSRLRRCPPCAAVRPRRCRRSLPDAPGRADRRSSAHRSAGP